SSKQTSRPADIEMPDRRNQPGVGLGDSSVRPRPHAIHRLEPTLRVFAHSYNTVQVVTFRTAFLHQIAGAIQVYGDWRNTAGIERNLLSFRHPRQIRPRRAGDQYKSEDEDGQPDRD